MSGNQNVPPGHQPPQDRDPRRTAVAGFDARCETSPRGTQCRHQSKSDARRQRNNQAEREQPQIHLGAQGDREVGRDRNRPQEPHAQVAEPNSRKSSGRGQQKAFGEKLPHQRASRGADRHANRDLLRAGRSTSERQVRHIGAGDQQDEAGDSKQCERQGAIDGIVFEARAYVAQHRDRAAAVRLGVLRREACRDGPQFGLRFGGADARPEAAQQDRAPILPRGEIVGARAGNRLLVRVHRYIDVGIDKRLRPREILRCDADDREVGAVHANSFSKDRAVARVLAVPHVIADDRHRIPARDGVFVGAKAAAEQWPDTQSAEEIPAHAGVEAVLRKLVRVGGDSAEKEVITGQSLERFRAIAQVDVIGIGQAPQSRAGRGRIDLDNPARIRNRQRTEQYRIDIAEHRGVGPDAQGERNDGYEREAGRLRQGPDGKAEVGRQSHTEIYEERGPWFRFCRRRRAPEAPWGPVTIRRPNGPL